MLYKEIGKNIRAFRILRQLTQEKLAERAGISLSFLGHIERGTRKLSVETLYKIAVELDCSVDELMGVITDQERKQQNARTLLRQVMALLDEYQ